MAKTKSKSKITNYTVPTEFADLLGQISDEIGYSQSQIVRWLLPTALMKFYIERQSDPGGAVIRAKLAEAETATWMLRRSLGVSNDPVVVAPPAPTAPASQIKAEVKVEREIKFPDKPWPIDVIKRGPVVWFHLDELCKAYQVAPDVLRRQIDVEDELSYMGKDWCDQVAITHLKELCPDPQLEAKVSAWVVLMQQTTT